MAAGSFGFIRGQQFDAKNLTRFSRHDNVRKLLGPVQLEVTLLRGHPVVEPLCTSALPVSVDAALEPQVERLNRWHAFAPVL